VPVAKAGGRLVSFRAWDDLAIAQVSYQNRLKAIQGAQAQPVEAVRRQALDSAVRLAATRRLAERYGVRVTGPEIQQQVQRSIDQNGNPAQFVQTLERYWGWDVPTFTRVVVEPYLLRQKVDQAIAADQNLGENPKTKADRVVGAVREAGADFSAIAKKESEDLITSTDGGSTLITRSSFDDPAVTEAVFALTEGEISNILTTGTGHYIVRVEKILKDDSTGETVLQARKIFIRLRTVDTVVADELGKTPPRVFIAPYRWDAQRGCVTAPGLGCGT
jgi:parvulin-like peptidyl-prolyl isomerase